ncbi:hypothetical protein [uncultured Sphingomonas sp.]|uniref:hypothetical protein n=1 Tax=uncultured Sphingomonas sp. TaxID=158754 RepID=UPI0025E88EB2|nr:hypothetical protein [uncultured Sphingomonas sp.]
MSNVATLPIEADRYVACVRQIYIRGMDLTGVAMRAQVRQIGDTPDAPLVDLQTVTNGNAEGLRLVGVDIVDGLPVSHVEMVINETTLQRLPYLGELGDATRLAWDWQLTLAGRKQRIARGDFVITGDGVTGADNAPTDRPQAWSRSWSTGSGMRTGAQLIFGDEVMAVTVDGANLVSAEVGRAVSAQNRAEAAQQRADMSAGAAQGVARYFTTRAAGEAASAVDQAFATDDGAGNVIYYKRTSSGSVEIGRAVTPASLSGAGGANRVGFGIRTLASKLGDGAASPADYSEWGSDNAAAIRKAIATGADVYIPTIGETILYSSVGQSRQGQRIYGRGKDMTFLRKAFNGDFVELALTASLSDMTLDGDGASFTGRGVVISEGSSVAGLGYQRVDRVGMIRMQGYCVEWTKNAAGWGGGMSDCDVRRFNDLQAALKMPAVETNGNRCLVNVFAGSGPLIDIDGAANIQLVGCMSGSYAGAVNAIRTTKNSAKLQIIGGRFATGGGTTILLGQNHTVVGMSHAGPFQLGDGTANSLINSKGTANDFAGFPVTDLSLTDTGAVNAFDLPLSIVLPAWTASGTAPSIGNGLLAAALSRSGGHVTYDLDLVFGSTTTAGSGAWSFETPVRNFGRRACGAAWMVNPNGANPIFAGVAIIEPGALVIQIYPHQANICQANSPFAWGDKAMLSFTLTYLAG